MSKPYLPVKGHNFRAYQRDTGGRRHYHCAGTLKCSGREKRTVVNIPVDVVMTEDFEFFAYHPIAGRYTKKRQQRPVWHFEQVQRGAS